MLLRENKFAKCYVAFLDILGFSTYVNKLAETESDKGFSILNDLFSELKNLAKQRTEKNQNYSPDTLKSLSYYIMSDSIIISIPVNISYSLDYLAEFCNDIVSFVLLKYSLFVRGGISSGLIYIKDTTVFGKALVDSAMLEKHKAKYPRIILSSKIVDKYINYMELNNQETQLSFYIRKCEEKDLYETSPLEFFFLTIHNLDVRQAKNIYLETKSYLMAIFETLSNKEKDFLKPKSNKLVPNIAIKTLYFINYYNELVKKYKLENELYEVDLSMEISTLLANIQNLCAKNNISIDKMLKECGLSKSVVDNMKRKPPQKPSMPSVDKICTIAQYFDVSTDYLLGLDEVPNRKEKSPAAELTETEQKLIDTFRLLNNDNKIKVSERALTLAESQADNSIEAEASRKGA